MLEESYNLGHKDFDPQPGAGIAYDAARMIVNALKKVGPNKHKAIKEMRADKFSGVIGRMECDNLGQCGRRALILQVKEGKPVVVWPWD